MSNLLNAVPKDKPLSKRKPLHMSRKKTDKGKHWTDGDKLKVLAAYAVTGSPMQCEELTGVPVGTIKYWMNLPWWFEELEKLRKAEDEKLVSKYTKIILKTMEQLETRLDTGDEVVLKSGDRVRKEVSARDLAAIANVMADKRHKSRESNTGNSVKSVSVGERLKQLEDQFTKFVTSKVVEGEVIHKVIEITAPEVKDIDCEAINNEGLLEETRNEGEEGIQEARKEGIEEIREEGRQDGDEEVQEEVLNAFQIQEAGQNNGGSGS